MKMSDVDVLVEKEWKASKKLCKSSTPNNKLGNSALSSCKAQGYRARSTGKTQKMGDQRVKLGGKRIRAEKYGGPVSPTKTG
tara:strand:- start:106 stop:351 length:246 start_codon:yes stop_codon:yes gene_type:complete